MRYASITNIHVHGKLIYGNAVPFKNKNTTWDFRHKCAIQNSNWCRENYSERHHSIQQTDKSDTTLKNRFRVIWTCKLCYLLIYWMLPVRKFSGVKLILQRHWLYNITHSALLFTLKRQNILIVILLLWCTHNCVC